MTTINFLDTYKFYKGLPGQIAAAKYLDEILSVQQKEAFSKFYRSNSIPAASTAPIYLLCEKTDGYDEFGLRILRLSLMNGDRTVDKIAVCSGQSYAQEFIDPRDDYSGSMRPAPEGIWDISAIDDIGYDPGSSDGFGRYFVPIVQRSAPNNRGEFGLHQDRNRATSPGCFPKDEVEILTKAGWVSADAYDGVSPVAQLVGDEIVFEEVYGVIDSPYKGKMIEFGSNQLNMFMTPNHRVALRAKVNNEGIRYLPASTVSLMSEADIPITGTYRNTDGDIDVLEARWLACVMADGRYPRKESGRLCFHLKKERKIERIKELALTVGVELDIRPEQVNGAINIYCERKFPEGMTNDISKNVDPNLALRMTPEARRAFLLELEHWDGSNIGPRSFKWDGTNKTHRDLILFVAALSGYRTSTRIQKQSNPNWKDVYRINLSPRVSYKLSKPSQEGSWTVDWHKDWEGQVWCLETKTTNFLVRHRGSIFVTGNSAGCISPYNAADMLKIITWLQSVLKPKYLVVDWGLSYLKSIGVSYAKK
jgi:hypothetical protein